MIMYDEYMRGYKQVNKLGFSNNNYQPIPQNYLDQQQFVVFRTCHSFGDWAIISAIPKLLKRKYPKCTIAIPSPECLNRYYNQDQWTNKSNDPFNNVLEVFSANPYIDGMIDYIPKDLPIYHDHFRVYDDECPNIPLTEQILKYWGFSEDEMMDSQPDLYWSDEEKQEGDRIIKNIIKTEDYGFLYLDDTFYIECPNPIREPLDLKRRVLQNYIDQNSISKKIKWLYYSAKDMCDMVYRLPESSLDVRSINTTLRIQSYIKSKSKLIIGHQGGYGTDCMSRYAPCYIVPNTYNHINEHIVRGTKYISCYEDKEDIFLSTKKMI